MIIMTNYSWISFYLLLLLIIQITLSDVSVYNPSSEKAVETLPSQEGNIEPEIPSKGISGYLTITNPPEGCTKIEPPPNIPTFGYQWIALIRRSSDGSCSFVDKVANAREANFSAVIIYNYQDSLVTMQTDGRNVGIPSTFIKLSDGSKLIEKYVYNVTSSNATPTYYVKITPDESFEYGPYLIIFMCITTFSCLSLLGCLCVKCIIQRRRARRHRLPRSALKKLRTKKFVKEDPWDTCAICLDDYEEGAKLRILPCEHAYHVKCIDPWLIENRRQCPVCKRYVFPHEQNSDAEENGARAATTVTTERTPLITPNITTDNNPSRNRPILTRQGTDSPGNTPRPDSSYLRDDSSDDDKDLSLSSGPATTAELVFQRSSANPRRYGSTNNSSITSRNANLLIASLGGITNNTNVSGHSLPEDNSDFETNTANDERMHSMRHVPEENAAYIDDERVTTIN